MAKSLLHISKMTKTEKEMHMEIAELQRKILDLKVVLDTAQAAIRRAESVLEGDNKRHVINQSAKWVLKYKL